MRYCSHCGSELNETDSHCPKCGAPTKNFGGSSAWEEISKTRKLLIGCSILAILLMFVNWGKISYWVFGTVNISPVSIVRNLNESMDLLQSILPQKYSGYCTLFMLYIVALFIGHGASIFYCSKTIFTPFLFPEFSIL